MKIIDLVDKTTAQVSEAPKPSLVDEKSVLIKVAYSAVDTALEEVAHRTFIPGSLLHDLKVKPLVPGWHFSGTIEEMGKGVHDMKVGDKVFGHLQYAPSTKQGSCAEYIIVPYEDCAKVPNGVALDIAAAVSTEAMTALQAMRDEGGLAANKNVLVIAAGGGVGTQAIQIAKAMGASVVDGVCSTRDVEKVKKLGADHVFDRTQADITKQGTLEATKYDVILDATGKYWFGSLKHALKPGTGSMVTTVPNVTTMMFGWAVKFWNSGKTYKGVMCKSQNEDLILVADWLQQGKIASVPIDSTHDVKDFMKAWERQKDPKKTGRVVIKVEGGW